MAPSYIIRRFSIKLDSSTNRYRVEVVLERAENQDAMNVVEAVPWPSQLDDWHLYEKHEAETVRKHLGERGYIEWKIRKEEEKLDRQH